ncbi:MAG: sulfurtransferase TusA family protein [Thermoproteota archaeon]|jgi:Predicted redox protein, regulator of disulfide bond formation
MEIKKQVLDARNLMCPYPSFLTVKKLNEIEKGTILEVLCDKVEMTINSLTTTLKNRGYRFEVKEEEDKYVIEVYKD